MTLAINTATAACPSSLSKDRTSMTSCSTQTYLTDDNLDNNGGRRASLDTPTYVLTTPTPPPQSHTISPYNDSLSNSSTSLSQYAVVEGDKNYLNVPSSKPDINNTSHDLKVLGGLKRNGVNGIAKSPITARDVRVDSIKKHDV